MAKHIFIDNSNIFTGAQRTAAAFESDALPIAVRVYYANLFRLLHADDHVETKVFAGSITRLNDSFWECAKRAGYDTDLLRRIPHVDGRSVEQGVDEIVHLKIANALLDFEPPQTLVLVTGDGNESDFGTSFIKQIERALKRGWRVQVWAWRCVLSKKFRSLLERSGGAMTIHELDAYYMALTFVQSGSYEIFGITKNIVGRNADALPARTDSTAKVDNIRHGRAL